GAIGEQRTALADGNGPKSTSVRHFSWLWRGVMRSAVCGRKDDITRPSRPPRRAVPATPPHSSGTGPGPYPPDAEQSLPCLWRPTGLSVAGGRPVPSLPRPPCINQTTQHPWAGSRLGVPTHLAGGSAIGSVSLLAGRQALGSGRECRR